MRWNLTAVFNGSSLRNLPLEFLSASILCHLLFSSLLSFLCFPGDLQASAMEESLEPSQGCFSFKELNLGRERSQQKKQRQKATVAAAAAAAALRCPRCDSANTKFCYYNNYSKLQPRHYCRACRRHWTEGGALRNVPVGGSRKNKQHLKDKRADSRSDRRIRFSTNDDSSTLEQESIRRTGGGMLVCHPTPPLDGELSMADKECGPLFPPVDDHHPSSLFYDHAAQPDAIFEGLLVLPAASNISHWDDIIDLVNLELELPDSEIVDPTLTHC